MIRTTARCLACLAALILLTGDTSTTLAQTGSVAGMVVDSETGETLIGANVIVESRALRNTNAALLRRRQKARGTGFIGYRL